MKNRNVVNLVLLAFVVIGLSSCGDEFESLDDFDVYEQYKRDSVKIASYIDAYELDAYDIGNTGVYISFSHYEGNDTLGQPSRDSDTSTTVQYVTAGYKGYFVDGTVFDETEKGESITFALSNVISGWQIGIPEMHQGDSATILIPSYWGYGYYGQGSVPGNTVLIFDVFLESHERK